MRDRDSSPVAHPDQFRSRIWHGRPWPRIALLCLVGQASHSPARRCDLCPGVSSQRSARQGRMGKARPVTLWRGSSALVVARPGRQGLARRVSALSGIVWRGLFGQAGLIAARFDTALRAAFGKSWRGRQGKGRFGAALFGISSHYLAGWSTPGVGCSVLHWQRASGMVRLASASCSSARIVLFGLGRIGHGWHGLSWQIGAGQPSARQARRGPLSPVPSASGMAWCGTAGMVGPCLAVLCAFLQRSSALCNAVAAVCRSGCSARQHRAKDGVSGQAGQSQFVPGIATPVTVWQGSHGSAFQCTSAPGLALVALGAAGMEGQAWHDHARPILARQAGRGDAWPVQSGHRIAGSGVASLGRVWRVVARLGVAGSVSHGSVRSVSAGLGSARQAGLGVGRLLFCVATSGTARHGQSWQAWRRNARRRVFCKCRQDKAGKARLGPGLAGCGIPTPDTARPSRNRAGVVCAAPARQVDESCSGRQPLSLTDLKPIDDAFVEQSKW